MILYTVAQLPNKMITLIIFAKQIHYNYSISYEQDSFIAFYNRTKITRRQALLPHNTLKV